MSDKLTLGHAAGVSSTCGRCGGLIMDSGTHYGYAGKVCQCNWLSTTTKFITPETDAQILMDIRSLLKQLLEKTR